MLVLLLLIFSHRTQPHVRARRRYGYRSVCLRASVAVWRCRPDFTGAWQRGGADQQSDPPAAAARRILSVRQTAESPAHPNQLWRSNFIDFSSRRACFFSSRVCRWDVCTKTANITVAIGRGKKGRRGQRRMGSVARWTDRRSYGDHVSIGAGSRSDDSSVSHILSPTRLDGPCRRGAHTAAASTAVAAASASQESVLGGGDW